MATIVDARGNLLESPAQALVNTVNTMGVMGKGLALSFKRRYPINYQSYRAACHQGKVRPGRMYVTRIGEMEEGPRYIINFPTKRRWYHPSRMEDIDSGLLALVETIQAHRIISIAVPPLGCGNGGLSWGDVRPRIVNALQPLPELTVYLYHPT